MQEALTRLMRGAHLTRYRAPPQHGAATPTRLSCSSTGRIVERGTHDELLLRPGGLYQRLSQLQTNTALV
ncbi:MAG: hypothetical protein WKG07_01515 [Hymenobacter sp.]